MAFQALRSVTVCCALIALTLLDRAAAQEKIGAGLEAAMAENQRLLHQYTFKQRTEILIKGEEKLTKVDEVRFEPDGTRQLTPIQAPEPPKHQRGIRGRIAGKKRQEMREYADRLVSLAIRYLVPDPAKIREALPNAQIAKGDSNGREGTRINFKNYVKQGDSVTLVLDRTTRKPQRIEAQTDLDNAPVDITEDFESLARGPTYMARAEVKASAKNLEIRITTYDYNRR